MSIGIFTSKGEKLNKQRRQVVVTRIFLKWRFYTNSKKNTLAKQMVMRHGMINFSFTHTLSLSFTIRYIVNECTDRSNKTGKRILMHGDYIITTSSSLLKTVFLPCTFI